MSPAIARAAQLVCAHMDKCRTPADTHQFLKEQHIVLRPQDIAFVRLAAKALDRCGGWK